MSVWQSASILANVSSTNLEYTNTTSSVYYNVLPILYIQHRFTMDIWCLDCIRACNHMLGGIFSAAHKKTILLMKQAQNNLKFSTSCIPTSLLTTLLQTQRHYPFSSSCCTKLEVTFQIAVLNFYLAFSIFVEILWCGNFCLVYFL